MADPLNQEKRALLLKLLEHGTVMIHLDARRPGVEVPERFRQDPHLRLNLDYNFRIPDFEVSEELIIASLSFSQQPYPCRLPLDAVWGITSARTGQSAVYPDSVPLEVLGLLALQEKQAAEEAASAKEEQAKPRLVSAPSAEEPPAAEETAPAAEPEKDPPSPPRRGHLRLVKS